MQQQRNNLAPVSFQPCQFNSSLTSENINVSIQQQALRKPPILIEELLDRREQAAEDEDEEYGDPEVGSFDVYSWEGGYDRSWDRLGEKNGVLDVFGSLLMEKDMSQRTHSSAKNEINIPTRKGVIRNVVFLLDVSEAMKETDYKPDRLNFMTTVLEDFFATFFQSNPLAHIGVVAMLHGQAITVTQLSGCPAEQIERLDELRGRDIAGGSVSLFNGLERGLALLVGAAPYATREIIILFGSIKTCDAGNIEDVLTQLKDRGVQTSVISFAPELYILKRLCNETNGKYTVCRSQEELKDAITGIKCAPEWGGSMETRLVPMGFPKRLQTTTVSLCACHNRPSLQGYFCPRCRCKVCEVPAKCPGCQLHLASSADISRTTQHFLPPPTSEKLPHNDYNCRLCGMGFQVGGVQCSGCKETFCHWCDVYKLDILQQCPTCLQQQELSIRNKR